MPNEQNSAMRLDDFDYELPHHLIAINPIEPRAKARLLVIPENGDFQDKHIGDLPQILQPNDLLVYNDCAVIRARIDGHVKGKTAVISFTFIKSLSHLYNKDGQYWQIMAKPAKKLAIGDEVILKGNLPAIIKDKYADGSLLLFLNINEALFFDHLDEYGDMPLPPYIEAKRKADGMGKTSLDDDKNYQTIFANKKGAVAAPTAGLHIDEDMKIRLMDGGIKMLGVTLLVGAGTFQPVKTDDISQHHMHSEWGEVHSQTAKILNQHKANGGRIITLGTTSLRILESATDENGIIHPFQGETDIFITPGYRFFFVDGLITNFHLPKSTLLMLVSACVGLDRIKQAYGYAKDKGYRFYSYGDACYFPKLPQNC